MGKKKRKFPQVEEVLARPWCYYCERDFDDLKILISHQKAKHFKCDRCGRRLNTAGGLSVHMNQVHKENLSHVENALPNRKGLDIEIFGMEGVPEEVIQQHQQRVLQEFYEAQKERQIATGNPPAGSGKSVQPKKPRLESSSELKARLREWLAKKAAGQTGSDLMPMDTDPPTHQLNAGGATLSPSQTQSPLPLVYILELLRDSSLLIDTSTSLSAAICSSVSWPSHTCSRYATWRASFLRRSFERLLSETSISSWLPTTTTYRSSTCTTFY